MWCVCVRACLRQPADTSFPPCTGGCQQKEDSLCTVELTLSLFLIIPFTKHNCLHEGKTVHSYYLMKYSDAIFTVLHQILPFILISGSDLCDFINVKFTKCEHMPHIYTYAVGMYECMPLIHGETMLISLIYSGIEKK